jgi:hypothetical protein
MNRPFEVGDMVILVNNEVGIISSLAMKQMPFVEFENGDYFHFHENNIKTIRTPRQGSTESRAIVAMLAREYKKSLAEILKTWINLYETNFDNEEDAKKDYWKKRKSLIFTLHNYTYKCYIKAKSMLK